MFTESRKRTKSVLNPRDALDALQDVLAYLWYDEGRHHEESRPDRRRGDIYTSRRQITL